MNKSICKCQFKKERKWLIKRFEMTVYIILYRIALNLTDPDAKNPRK